MSYARVDNLQFGSSETGFGVSQLKFTKLSNNSYFHGEFAFYLPELYTLFKSVPICGPETSTQRWLI